MLVLIEEGEGFTVEENALLVPAGEDAVFLLRLDRGISILSTDYRGAVEITERDGLTELRLRAPRYPTRVKLQTASKKGQIRYEYTVLNLALNGTVNSAVQLQIMAAYLEPGDILFHTPEISSRFQLMLLTEMREDDSRTPYLDGFGCERNPWAEHLARVYAY